MLMIKLSNPNATIGDVLHTIEEPELYVRRVIKHLLACRDKHGNARVHIGISGKGKYPFHRIMWEKDGESCIFATWDGDTERKSFAAYEASWSPASMTFEEVIALLKEKFLQPLDEQSPPA